jgi:hypothetical protein
MQKPEKQAISYSCREILQMPRHQSPQLFAYKDVPSLPNSGCAGGDLMLPENIGS